MTKESTFYSVGDEAGSSFKRVTQLEPYLGENRQEKGRLKISAVKTHAQVRNYKDAH